MERSYSFKLLHENEYRRFSVTVTPTFTDLFSVLMKEVHTLLNDNTLAIGWTDEEGDSIKLTTPRELSEAFKYREKQSNLFKIHTIKSIPKKKSCHEDYYQNNAYEHNKFDHGVDCTNCDRVICGIRYQCVICQDYSLCEGCEHAFVHPEHALLRIVNNETQTGTMAPASFLLGDCRISETSTSVKKVACDVIRDPPPTSCQQQQQVNKPDPYNLFLSSEMMRNEEVLNKQQQQEPSTSNQQQHGFFQPVDRPMNLNNPEPEVNSRTTTITSTLPEMRRKPLDRDSPVVIEFVGDNDPVGFDVVEEPCVEINGGDVSPEVAARGQRAKTTLEAMGFHTRDIKKAIDRCGATNLNECVDYMIRTAV